MVGRRICCYLVLILSFAPLRAAEVIRVNQLGYLPESIKVAVFLSTAEAGFPFFTLHDTLTDEVVFTGEQVEFPAGGWGLKRAFRLDFSGMASPGAYYLRAGGARSPDFRINADIYRGTADFILNYLRQQRCGYNPFLHAPCHLHDGVIVDHPTRSGEAIDVTGGWHDASDYLQYSTTSVNTLFQLMFAYRSFPEIYGDYCDGRGEPGSNGVPDILDEIRWGLDWALKMNPAPGEFYNQIADDRDHVGFRLPSQDRADYGMGEHRPVYFVTGRPQGLGKYRNRSTGVSSIAGKFASAFALGAMVFSDSDPGYARRLKAKALEAWEFALSEPGYTQTACNVSPYFYEESNFVDDLELAATQLFRLTGDRGYLEAGAGWGRKEPVSPWMEKGEARHYQYYPFVNLGHYFLAREGDREFATFYRQGLEYLLERGEADPFRYGLPFIWCSNNLAAAALTQSRLYAEVTGSDRFAPMEAALRDWLFGCNPWGTAMICGLPGALDSPRYPHSSYTVLMQETTAGGLVDGPVYDAIFSGLIGIRLTGIDEYAPFNRGRAVYHDDTGDYSTNEPTLDGTASLSYYLAALEADGRRRAGWSGNADLDRQGAVIRVDRDEKKIYLAFSADTSFEGGETVLEILNARGIKASFFFTGNFLRDPGRAGIVREIIDAGHYVGAHSDRHLLYCDWEDRDSTLVSREEFREDLRNNYRELRRFGVKMEKARLFLPPFEWYNREIVNWSRELGLEVVNFTPGTGTNADYTSPGMENYRSSEEILAGLESFARNSGSGLNGAILLIHPGTPEERVDKLYQRLGGLIDSYLDRGYRFGSLDLAEE